MPRGAHACFLDNSISTCTSSVISPFRNAIFSNRCVSFQSLLVLFTSGSETGPRFHRHPQEPAMRRHDLAFRPWCCDYNGHHRARFDVPKPGRVSGVGSVARYSAC